MTDREVMQQALEALESGLAFDTHSDVLQNLRTALEQQQAEPVLWQFRESEMVSPYSKDNVPNWRPLYTTPPQQQAEPVSMRMPKVGDKVICLEDESLGKVVSLTAGGSPDILFDDGSHGTYLLREFAELFGYVAASQQQAEPPPEWLLIKNILDEYGLQAIDFVAEFKAAQQVATIWKQAKPFLPEAINTTQTAWRMGYEAAKAEQQQAEPVAWDKPSDNFNEWWNGDYEDPANPFEKDSAAYWAWAGWQAAQRPWVGLTDEDWEQIHDRKDTSLDTFEQGAVWAANQLKERNT